MPLFQLLLVSIIQGVTEFLPVSSSGHLLLLPHLSGSEDQGQMIDIAAHVGTLGAVILYFRRDVIAVAAGCLDVGRGNFDSGSARLAICLAIATIPVLLAGLLLHLSGLGKDMRSIGVVGIATLVFAIVLYVADRLGPAEMSLSDWTPRRALALGMWQCIALVPGSSRSGVVITGARLLGFGRRQAARLSLLMSIPTIAAAGALAIADRALDADLATLRDGGLVAVVSFLVALLAIHLMLLLLRRVSYTPYVIYRLILGSVLVTIAWS